MRPTCPGEKVHGDAQWETFSILKREVANQSCFPTHVTSSLGWPMTLRQVPGGALGRHPPQEAQNLLVRPVLLAGGGISLHMWDQCLDPACVTHLRTAPLKGSGFKVPLQRMADLACQPSITFKPRGKRQSWSFSCSSDELLVGSLTGNLKPVQASGG